MIADIEPLWGSHTGVLANALAQLDDGALVIEHGAGLYSSPVIRDSAHRVVCIESFKGWRSWADWLYGSQCTVLERAKQAVALLADADLVFIDGLNSERGDLLKWSIEAQVPCIIAHDTQDDMRKRYGYLPHLFQARDYVVTHDAVRPRTTMWRLK